MKIPLGPLEEKYRASKGICITLLPERFSRKPISESEALVIQVQQFKDLSS
jgi:hypothetical protein